MNYNEDKPVFFNPFFVEDEEDRITPQLFVNPLLEDDDEDEEIYQGITEQPQNGSESPLREQVRELADRPIYSPHRVPNGVSTPVAPADSVKAPEKKLKLPVDSDFKRQNVEEIIVKGDEPEPRKRNKHIMRDGRMTGAELAFFRNLKVSKYDTTNEKLEVLRGKIDGNNSPAAKKARNLLFNEAIDNKSAFRRGSSARFSEKDQEVLQFLAQFRYAKTDHMAIAFNRAPKTINERLKKMRQQGLVLSKEVYGTKPVWYLTEAGMLLSGYDLPRVTEGKMSMMMFPHSFAINHAAAQLWGGGVNVLNLKDFPALNRTNAKGEPVRGERLISELQITSSFGKVKQFEKAEVFAPQLKATIDRDFSKWEEAGGVSFGSSPETYMGNEFMYALLPPTKQRLAYHVPDFVVVRDRGSDGSPESIAVEVEISNKEPSEYEKVLKAYEADDRFFKRVVWICKSLGAARKLEKAAKNIGLWQQGRIGIVPIFTDHGVYQERDLWYL